MNNKTEIIADSINLDKVPEFSRQILKVNILSNALGEHWQVPVMVLRGSGDGPVLGVTAALHGNELNGISIIHKLIQQIDLKNLRGTLLAVPVLNVPGFLREEREFSNGKDLNRQMPGNPEGTSSERYCYELFHKIIKHCDYLIDLHTASFGRINSLYVRANMDNDVVAQMALLQEPAIIVNCLGEEGTLRRAAITEGIPTITVEAGDSHQFQKKHIRPSFFGIWNVMIVLGMLKEKKAELESEPVICKGSYWLYADCGGILEVYPELTTFIKQGELIARIKDVFGEIIIEVVSPTNAYVVAKSINPVCHSGSRIIHLGVPLDA